MGELAQTVRVYPCQGIEGILVPPSSKYHTVRYILAAVLAEGESVVNYPAQSDDTDVLLPACRALGAHIEEQIQSDGRLILRIVGTGGALKVSTGAEINVGNAGAVTRLLVGIGALTRSTVRFTTPYPDSLGRRPNADLLNALEQLGVRTTASTQAGTLPVTLVGEGLHGGVVKISGRQSSQYLSALLFLGPLLEEGLEIEVVDGLTSATFVDLTISILATAGITVLTRERYRRYTIPGGQHYQARDYNVPGDYPSAAALLGVLAAAGGQLTLKNLAEGDADGEAMLSTFTALGIEITRRGQEIVAHVAGPLRGINLDGNAMIDSVPVIVAAACGAREPSRVYNVANLHLKESDRIQDLTNELRKSGYRVHPQSDAIEIEPVDPAELVGGVDVEAHADHRLIQALSIGALRCAQPVTIRHAQHIAKSYPRFFADLIALGVRVEDV